MPSASRDRPGVPLLLLCALGMWAASAACYLSAADVPIGELLPVAVLSGVIAILDIIVFGVCVAWRKRSGFAAKAIAVASFVAMGVLLGNLAAATYGMEEERLPAGEREATLTLQDDPRTGEFDTSATALLESEGVGTVNVRASLPDGLAVYSGAILTARVVISPLSDSSREYSYANGIVGRAKVIACEVCGPFAPLGWVYELRARAIGLFAEYGGQSAPLLQALVCGYRPPISESGEYGLYQQCGLAHVVAVSGAHLAIVVAAFSAMLKLLRCSRRTTLGVAVVFTIAYLLFAGIPISAIRASVMVILSMLAGMFGRRGASLGALSLCIIAFIVVDPVTSVSVSFFLSAASTLGIVLFSSLFASWMGRREGIGERTEAVGKGLIEPLALTFSSNIVTLPFSVAMFSMLPLVAPLANIVATPLFTIACVCGLLCVLASCALPPLVPIALGLASLAAEPLRASVDLLARVPYGCIALEADALQMLALSSAICVTLWAFWPRSPAKPLACLLAVGGLVALGFGTRLMIPHGDEIVMLDVGQGDAVLVRSGTSAVLIDTGNQDAKLREGLMEEGIVHLDGVLVTHGDDDHCGSLGALFGSTQVDRVIVAADMLGCGCSRCEGLMDTARSGVGAEGIVGVAVGDSMRVGRFELEVVWPDGFSDEGGNGDSLCVLARIDCDQDGEADWRTLLTGDAESDELARMIEAGRVGDIDVLKVGHHGSKVSLDDGTVRAIDPELALISVGANNRYGHPSSEVLAYLDSVDARVMRTDEDGAIRISFRKGGLEVE